MEFFIAFGIFLVLLAISMSIIKISHYFIDHFPNRKCNHEFENALGTEYSKERIFICKKCGRVVKIKRKQ